MKLIEIRQPNNVGGLGVVVTTKRAEGWFVVVHLHNLDLDLGKGPFDTEAEADKEAMRVAVTATALMKTYGGAELHVCTEEEIAQIHLTMVADNDRSRSQD